MVPPEYPENEENREKQDLRDEEEKRGIEAVLDRRVCRDPLGYPENQYLRRKPFYCQVRTQSTKNKTRLSIAQSVEILRQGLNGNLKMRYFRRD